MSASNYFENALLALIFNNTSINNIANGLGVAGNLYISLHTADPGEAGSQETNEANYTSYSRVPVSRDNLHWSVTNNQASNAQIVSFPLATGGSSLVTHWSVGENPSGAGEVLISGALTTSLAISNGIRPIFDVNDLKISLE